MNESDRNPNKSKQYYYIAAILIILIINTIITPLFFKPQVHEVS